MAASSKIKHLSDSVGEIIAGNFSTSPTLLRLTSSSNALTTALALSTGGTYRIRATVDCFFVTSNIAVEATTMNAHFLPAGEYEDIPVISARGPQNVAAITDGGSGYLYISPRPRTF